MELIQAVFEQSLDDPVLSTLVAWHRWQSRTSGISLASRKTMSRGRGRRAVGLHQGDGDCPFAGPRTNRTRRCPGTPPPHPVQSGSSVSPTPVGRGVTPVPSALMTNRPP